MIKVTAMHVGQVSYVMEEMAYDDYLSQGGESPGIWLGRGAKRLGLSGPVDATTLTNLLKGMTPDGSQPLVQLRAIRKDREHDAGWMLTTGMPKSVSLLGALGNSWVSQQVAEADLTAIAKTVEYIEDHYAFTRRGSGGQRVERCHLLYAGHCHLTNRNGEPHGHWHLSGPNLAFRTDGTTGTLVSKAFYDAQLEIGAVYRVFLATELCRRLGLELEADGDSFRVVGIPKKLEKAFSTRTAEVLEEMAIRGTSGPRASEEAAKKTRKAKKHVPHDVLVARWRHLAESMGFGEAQIRALVRPHSTQQAVSESQPQQRAPDEGNPKVVDIRYLSDRQHHRLSEAVGNPPRQVTDVLGRDEASAIDQPKPDKELPEPRRFRESAQDFSQQGQPQEPGQNRTTSQSGEQSQRYAAKAETHALDAVALKRLIVSASEAQVPKDGISRLIDHLIDKVPYSRREQNKFEESLGTPEERVKRLNELLSIAASAAGDRRHYLSPSYVNRQFSRLGGQGEAFREAAVDIMSLKGASAVVQTSAGTERETFLRTLRDIYRAAGYRVVGVTPTGTAAAHLEATTGIPTHSATQHIYRTSPSVGTVLKHHTTEMLHALLNRPTYKFERWSMDRKTVLVVADAQTLHTPDIKALQSAARTANAKIVFIGDTHQFKAREPANPFDALAKRLGTVRLPDSPRPVEAWAQGAIDQVSRGDVTGALNQYAFANRLYLTRDHSEAAAKLVRQWVALPQQKRGAETLIIAPGLREASILNRAAQYARKEKGELGWLLRQRIDGGWMYRNDRVRFIHNSKSFGYKNGDSGTIERIGLEGLTVRLDRNSRAFGFQRPIRVHVPRSRYEDLTLGYALSAFHAQSVAGKMAFVLTDGDQRNSVALRTQLSWATDETRVFAARHAVDEEVEQVHDLVQTDLLRALANKPLVQPRPPSRWSTGKTERKRAADSVQMEGKQSEESRDDPTESQDEQLRIQRNRQDETIRRGPRMRL